MVFVVIAMQYFTYVWFLGFSILILYGPFQINSAQIIASRLWTPPTLSEHTKRHQTLDLT
jgi:hypothetical protein